MEATQNQPDGPPRQRIPAREVLVVELDDEDDAAEAAVPLLQKAEDTLKVQVSATAPAVIVPAAALPCPGARAVLATGLAAIVLCFLPVVYLSAPLPAAGAIVLGIHLLKRINHQPNLTGRGMINTAILLGVIAALLGISRAIGTLLFWSVN